MKKILFPALLAFTLLAAPSFAQSPVANSAGTSAPRAAKATKASVAAYKLQPQLSTLGWLGKKVGGQHNGTAQFQQGDLLVRGNKLVGGTVTVDMNSIKNEDLKDQEYNGKLMGHLRSDDFFSVEKFPTATLKITSLAPIKADAQGNNMRITGDLTIKGITKPVSFPAKVGVKNGVAAASGTAIIDRTQYDVKYGSTLFGAAADKAIDNDFALSFNVIAKK
ncbi:YceI family protein [Hymenobacter sp. DG25A]|uniref:YceI family protein n=1 Tax=Hymenobacter sp. DG25A TaxID=1385663 RepID=UPI0006BC2B08|nr:YceI family protein [Hymenobacter sp. DG25A]ALD21454.1 lipid-binding protein [Hymenobacter sp. DG25A]